MIYIYIYIYIYREISYNRVLSLLFSILGIICINFIGDYRGKFIEILVFYADGLFALYIE